MARKTSTINFHDDLQHELDSLHMGADGAQLTEAEIAALRQAYEQAAVAVDFRPSKEEAF